MRHTTIHHHAGHDIAFHIHRRADGAFLRAIENGVEPYHDSTPLTPLVQVQVSLAGIHYRTRRHGTLFGLEIDQEDQEGFA